MKINFLLLTVLFCTVNTIAQNTISGTVQSQTQEPISATIYIPQLEKGMVADFNGNYSISNIPDGTYTVIYSMLGYTTLSKKITLSENESHTEDIQLLESVVEMEEVIISTPFHKLQSDNVMKVERMSTDQIKATGAVSLAEGITNIAGVETISTGVGIGKPVIRGLSANRVLTYTQGVRLENQQFGGEHGLGVNDAGIESVEVIKGPASLLYGSDALGGVLYLNPERFAATGDFEADLNTTYYSNTVGTSSNFGAKTSSEKFKFLVRGAYVSHSDYKTGTGIRVTNTRFNEKDIKTGFGYQDTKLKSTLRYNYNRANIGIPEEIGVQTTAKTPLLPFQEIDNHIVSLDNTFFFTNSSLDAKMGYLFNDRSEFEETVDNAALRMQLNTFNYDVKYNFPQLGNFETIVGVQGMYQSNSNLGEEVLIPNATTTDFGILGTTHYHLEKIDFQAGLRLDIRKIDSEAAGTSGDDEYIAPLQQDFNSFNAAIGAKLDITENLVGRLNIASGFRAPNLAELTSNGVHEGTNRYEIGNPNLDNEQNIQTDLSLEFKNEHFEIAANGFYNALGNYIFISPTGETIEENPVFNYVQNDASLYGGEVGVHIHPHPLDWLHIESSFEMVRGELKDASNLPLLPANSLQNTLRIEFNDFRSIKTPYAFVGVKNTFKQDRISAFETESEGYNLVNLGAGLELVLKKLSIESGLTITNLLDTTYIAHLSRLKPDGIPNMGRNITFHLKVTL
ncbi:iron complex outermembrane receptor protein [Ulvibacter sp. MAR_2010_11]|uniref:TonB-dependent receptor n=1 Tax=Ulvibacter sp. MAR_2010_11 TaxID=1250229 RepID=UPI000C2BF6B9|nr:TonB-dependent receptor [Ulvibacter sp. MAR_2010_11]PKA84066.1 iron complex outermembrane receptor protein [Ulvibacter sp. MAR_2010_11]